MAQIILQATAYNQKYSITPLVIDKDTYNQSKRVAIEVIPDDGYIVNAVNFYSGFLSPNILIINIQLLKFRLFKLFIFRQ